MRIPMVQDAEVVEVTVRHYHVRTATGKWYWIEKEHAVIQANVNDSVRLAMKQRGYVRQWWIESKPAESGQ